MVEGIAEATTNATETDAQEAAAPGGSLTQAALQQLAQAAQGQNLANGVVPDLPAAADTGLSQDEEGSAASPKDDPGRLQYWQSRADRAANALKQVEPYLPLVKAITENPQILERIERELANPRELGSASPALRQEATVPAPEALQKPVPPPKPERYDEMEAFSDPQSESFKYRKALEEYRDARSTYLEKREEIREAQTRAREEQLKQERYMQTKMAEVQATLQSKYGLSPVEAQDFMVRMQRPESLTLDNMVALYRLQKQGANAPMANRAQELAQRAARAHVPLPAGAGAGRGAQEASDTDKMVEAFRSAARSVKRF